MLGFRLFISGFVCSILHGICKLVQQLFCKGGDDVKNTKRPQGKSHDTRVCVQRSLKPCNIGAPIIRLSCSKFLELEESEFDQDVFVGKQTIENMFFLPVSYKIKAQHPKVFIARPARGIVEPGDSVEVTLYLKTKMQGDCTYQPEKIRVVTKVIDPCATPDDCLVRLWSPLHIYAEQDIDFTCVMKPQVEDDDDDEEVSFLSKWENLIPLIICVIGVLVLFNWYVLEPLATKMAYERMSYSCKLIHRFSPPFASVLGGFLDCAYLPDSWYDRLWFLANARM